MTWLEFEQGFLIAFGLVGKNCVFSLVEYCLLSLSKSSSGNESSFGSCEIGDPFLFCCTLFAMSFRVVGVMAECAMQKEACVGIDGPVVGLDLANGSVGKTLC